MGEKRGFVFRLAQRFPEARKKKVIGLGWVKIGDLSRFTDRDGIKGALRSEYPDMYKDNERAVGNAAGSIWRFIKEMNVGDLVAIPVQDGFHLVKIAGGVFFDPVGAKEDFGCRRPVEWMTDEPIPRSYAVNDLQLRLKARQTCVEATDLIEAMEESRRRKKPVSFVDTVMVNARAVVAEALRNAVNNVVLEKVVQGLASARGAKTYIPARNNSAPGDVDIIAIYDLRIGNQESLVKVAYQVKQHKGVSDEQGIQQLIDRMKDGEYRYGCFVTTATEVTETARNLADESDILVLAEKELVDWVLEVGLSALRTHLEGP